MLALFFCSTNFNLEKKMVLNFVQSAVAFRDENERRKTFEGFWSDIWPVSSKALAQAGFFYCGKKKLYVFKLF